MLFSPTNYRKETLFAFTCKKTDFRYTFIPREESLSIARASSRNKSTNLKGNGFWYKPGEKHEGLWFQSIKLAN